MKWFSKYKKEKDSAGISPSPPAKKTVPLDIDDIPESYSISHSPPPSISHSPSPSHSLSPSVAPSGIYFEVAPSYQFPLPISKKKITKPIIQETPEEKEKREKLNVRDYKREVDL